MVGVIKNGIIIHIEMKPLVIIIIIKCDAPILIIIINKCFTCTYTQVLF